MTLNVGGAGTGVESRIQQQEAMLDSHRQQAAQQDKELEARAQANTTLKAEISTVRAYMPWMTQ